MLKVKRAEKPVFMLVGNQSDKINEREVTNREGAEMAKAFGCPFFETSAKTATNVERIFTDLVKSLRFTKVTEGMDIPKSKEANGGSMQGNSQIKEGKRSKKCPIF